MIESRRPMIRYTGNLTTQLQTELALEVMEPRRLYDYSTSDAITYEPRRAPDFIGTLKYNMNPGFVKVAGIYRNIGYGSKGSYKSANGYGVSAMTTIFAGVEKKNNLQLQWNIGKGISDYLLSMGGSGFDGNADREDPAKLSLLPMHSGYASYQHYWTPKFHTLLIGSYNRFDGENNTFNESGTWNTMQNLYFGGNMMFDVVPSLTVGAEFLWGKKTLEYANDEKKSAPASRINFGFMYNF